MSDRSLTGDRADRAGSGLGRGAAGAARMSLYILSERLRSENFEHLCDLRSAAGHHRRHSSRHVHCQGSGSAHGRRVASEG